MASFATTLSVAQRPAEVFKAINQVAAWWQGKISGKATVGDEFSYCVERIHFSKQKAVIFIPDQQIEWLVTEVTRVYRR